MKRFYLGYCEYKWTHAHTHMEDIWVRKELDDELFAQCNQNGFKLVYQRTNSQSLPGDIYLRNTIFVDVDNKHCTMFVLKFPQAKLMEKIQ